MSLVKSVTDRNASAECPLGSHKTFPLFPGTDEAHAECDECIEPLIAAVPTDVASIAGSEADDRAARRL